MISVQDELIRGLEAMHRPEMAKIGRDMVETFSTAPGRATLEVIMTTLKMFREATTEEERHLQNAGKRILYLMGAGTEDDHVTAWLDIARKAALRRTAKGGRK